jgi:hypothetical protein
LESSKRAFPVVNAQSSYILLLACMPGKRAE